MPLTVVTGPMMGGKSSYLHWYVSRALRAKKVVDVCVPKIDTRSEGQVKTHSGLSLSSLGVKPRVVENSREVYEGLTKKRPNVLVVDEAQFFDIDLPLWVEKLLPEGLQIIAAGLDLTSEGYPFGPMGHLLCLADKVEKLTAICPCGAEATRTLCTVEKTGDVLVGGAGKYLPVCLGCWKSGGKW